MVPPSSMCPPKPPLAIPEGLVERLRERTGVAVRFFDGRGAPLPDDATAPNAAPGPSGEGVLARLVRSAIETGRDQAEAFEDGVAAAWPIRHHGRPTLVAAGTLDDVGPGGPGAERRLLAAVGEAVRHRFALAEADARCDSLSGALAQSFEEITLLHNVGEILRVTRPIPALLEYVCDELCETTGAEAAAACLPDADGGEPLVVSAGEPPVAEADLPRLMNDLLDGAGGAETIHNYCQDEPALARLSPALDRVAVVPLPLGDDAAGAVAIFNRPRMEFGSPDLKLVRSSANATAVFIENRRLYRDLRTMMLDLVRALVSSVDAKDPYTCGHSERVAVLCRELARQLGLTDEEIEQAYMAGLLHDIGKIGTPEAILCKEGSLLPEERRVIGEHPDVGGRILKDIKQLGAVREAVVHHHERLDGSGYPRGVSGEAVPLLARIVGLADSFDAMTSTRPYRESLPLGEVTAEIDRHTGSQFDPRVAEAFKRIDTARLMQADDGPHRGPCTAETGR